MGCHRYRLQERDGRPPEARILPRAGQGGAGAEMSKRGRHLWILLEKPLLAKDCRIYIHRILAASVANVLKRQDGRGFGNLSRTLPSCYAVPYFRDATNISSATGTF